MSLASSCFGDPSATPTSNLAKLQALSLDDKILYSTVKIKEFYIAMKGKVYVSFSGGKDSTVLLHLVRSVYPEVPAVYVDTGLEFPEIRDHVKTVENVTWMKPEMSFKKVIEEKGYPVISKSVSHWVDLAQRGYPSGLKQMQLDTRYGCKRYEYLVHAPFRVSRDCCDILKKRPAKQYTRETGRMPYIGIRADEGANRRSAYERVEDENNLHADIPKSSPIMCWTDKDIWDYIRRFDLPYSSIYDKGYNRTGCMFCMFGITFERDRFVKLKATHPKIWEYCMREREKGGLGMKEVLNYIHIPTGCEQTNLAEFSEERGNIMRPHTMTAIVSVGSALFCISVASFMIVLSLAPMLDGTTADEPLVAAYKVDGERFYVEYGPEEMLGYTEYFRGFSFTATAYRYATTGDPMVQRLYHTALEPRMAGMDDYGKADYLRKFVQTNVAYDFDIGMHGMSDYAQYPSETLISGRGDCEDSSVLLYTLYRLAGLESVLIESSDHVYVGVAVDGTGEYVTLPFSETRYYTVEPTSPWDIGRYGHDEDWHFVYHPYGVLVGEIALFFSLFGLISMWNYRNVGDSAVRSVSRTVVVGETE